MNNPFSMFGQLSSLFMNKFGTTNDMFSAINGFASQFDPKNSNPEQMARDLVQSGQMSQDQLESLYNMACGVYQMMNGGNRR